MAETAVTVSIALGVLLLFGYLYHYLMRKKRNYPPGPPGWPLFGNLFTLLFSKKHQHEVIYEWTEEYGPIFKFSLVGTNVYIISDMKLIQDAYQKNSNIRDRIPFTVICEQLGSLNCG